LFGTSIEQHEVVTNALEFIEQFFSPQNNSSSVRKLIDPWYSKEKNKSAPCNIKIEFEMTYSDMRPKDISEECGEHLSPVGYYFWNDEFHLRDEIFDRRSMSMKPLPVCIDFTFSWCNKESYEDYLITSYEVSVYGRNVLNFEFDCGSLENHRAHQKEISGLLTIKDEQRFENPFFGIDIFTVFNEDSLSDSFTCMGLSNTFKHISLHDGDGLEYVETIIEQLNIYLGKNLIKGLKHLEYLRNYAREIKPRR
jgi:hypothetical protein